MKWRVIAAAMLLAIPAYAEDAVIYDSSKDPAADSELKMELHQRVEGEEAAPVDHPIFELMTQPCMGWHFQAGAAVHNAETGRELLLLTSASEVGGTALLITSIQDGACVMKQIPETAGAWAMAPMRGDKIAIGTYYDGAIHVYDLPTDSFTAAVQVPGEAYIWNLVEGTDGRLYGGTFPGGKLIALNQETLELEDCGQAAPPNRFLHEVSPLPDGRMLCRAGDEAPVLRVYDPAAKSFSDAPETLAGVTGGVLWDEYFAAKNGVFDKELHPLSPPPFPLPDPAGGDWSILTAVTARHILYLQQGHAVYFYRKGDPGLTRVCDLDLKGGRVMASSVNGGLVGVRGQQFFHMPPGAVSLVRQQFNLASPPRVPAFLKADPSGQIWGAPPSGQTLFFMDAKTGVFVSLGSVTPRLGRVQDLAFMDQIAYGASYPGGDIFRLDIEAAWNEWDGENPRILYSLSSKGYGNLSGGIVASGDSKIFSGWSTPSGSYGGAIAVTDAASGQTRIAENPVGRQGIASLALGETYLFAGTSLKADGAPVKTGEAPQFAVLGADTLQLYWNHGFEGAVSVENLIYCGDSREVVMEVDGALRVFDINAMSIRPPFESAPPEITGACMADRKDGHVYYGHASKIIRVHRASGLWEEVLELPGEVGPLAAHFSGDLYAGCGANVYRIRFPEKYPPVRGEPPAGEKN